MLRLARARSSPLARCSARRLCKGSSAKGVVDVGSGVLRCPKFGTQCVRGKAAVVDSAVAVRRNALTKPRAASCVAGCSGVIVWLARGHVQCESVDASLAAPVADGLHVQQPHEHKRQRSEAAQAIHRRRRWRRWLRLIRRLCFLFCRGLPVMCLAPVCWLFWNHGGERWFWRLLLSTLQAYGPTAVKFAQWASTRPDILPSAVCRNFAELQANVKPHSWDDTAAILREAFGDSWWEKLKLDRQPVGSGCMAQVYRGVLVSDKHTQDVAVKVRHPGAQEQLDIDLDAMHLLVEALERVWRSSKYLAISEAVAHFESFIRPQADLRIEASNLESFSNHFEYGRTGRGLPVRFPQVIRPYVSDAVLVESLEGGTQLDALLRADAACNGGMCGNLADEISRSCGGLPLQEAKVRVAKVTSDAFLQMLFQHNFVHGDMHPGNIFFRFPNASSNGSDPGSPELILLDAGLAVRLSKEDRRNFVEVFHAIAMNDGQRVGQLILDRSPGDASQVLDGEGFVKSVGRLVGEFRNNGLSLGAFRMGDVFRQMLSTACEHRVKLETSFVRIVMTMITVEGVGRQLNPITDVIVAARPLLIEAMTDLVR